MPPLMFGGLILLMLIGFPVAFSLAALGLPRLFAIEMGWFPPVIQAIRPRVRHLSNDLLLAIPFFTFMGAILESAAWPRTCSTRWASCSARARRPGLFGHHRRLHSGRHHRHGGGQVIAMALISLPVMIRYGYNMRYTTGVLAASGTITQLVPPSLVLVVLADQLGNSVGDMYKGAWGPRSCRFAVRDLHLRARHHQAGPRAAVPKEARTLNGWALWKKCLRGIIPSAVLIFAVLGTMG